MTRTAGAARYVGVTHHQTDEGFVAAVAVSDDLMTWSPWTTGVDRRGPCRARTSACQRPCAPSATAAETGRTGR